MKKILILIVSLFFTLPLMAQNTILIVGNSISAGYGFDFNQSWVTLLKKRLQHEKYDYQVVNESVSGSTTSNGLNRLPKLLEKYQPQITIIELGGNDGLRGLSLTLIKHNLQKMVALAKEANSKVLLLGVRLPPNYGPDYTNGFQKIYTDVAQDEGVSVVPLFLQNVDDNPTMMQGDRIHPTASAQETILTNVWPVLKSMLT